MLLVRLSLFFSSVYNTTAPEPLANLYSPDFYRSTWLTTALDAGFATAMTIQPKFLRNTLSMVFFLYYLVYAREADEKVCALSYYCLSWQVKTSWTLLTACNWLLLYPS